MKNTEYAIINVYTQANGEKIAVSMLHKTKKGYYEQIKPTAAVEKYGKIEGEINSYWGKLPVVLVPVEQFAALKKEYDVIDFRGPVDHTRIRESKPRPDAMALKLYKVFAADAAAPQEDAYITIDGYRFPSGAGEYMLKTLKREYNFTKADIAAAYALTLDNAAADTHALTDADVLAAAARIKSNYEAMKQQAAADTFADAITAYCDALEEPAAPVWAPEVIILKEQPAAPAADAAPAPRHRRRLNIAPRLSRWLHPARWVAVAFVVCLLSGLLLGMNTSNAAADDIAAVYELHPVTVTAAAVTDVPAAPSPVKKLAAPSPVKNAAADAVTLPGQKTAADIATATAPAADDADSLTTAPAADGLQPTPPDGLTICAGTAWAYTMMNWA